AGIRRAPRTRRGTDALGAADRRPGLQRIDAAGAPCAPAQPTARRPGRVTNPSAAVAVGPAAPGIAGGESLWQAAQRLQHRTTRRAAAPDRGTPPKQSTNRRRTHQSVSTDRQLTPAQLASISADLARGMQVRRSPSVTIAEGNRRL